MINWPVMIQPRFLFVWCSLAAGSLGPMRFPYRAPGERERERERERECGRPLSLSTQPPVRNSIRTNESQRVAGRNKGSSSLSLWKGFKARLISPSALESFRDPALLAAITVSRGNQVKTVVWIYVGHSNLLFNPPIFACQSFGNYFSEQRNLAQCLKKMCSAKLHQILLHFV